MCDQDFKVTFEGPRRAKRDFRQGSVVALALEYRRACREVKKARRAYDELAVDTSLPRLRDAYEARDQALTTRECAAQRLLAYVAGRFA